MDASVTITASQAGSEEVFAVLTLDGCNNRPDTFEVAHITRLTKIMTRGQMPADKVLRVLVRLDNILHTKYLYHPSHQKGDARCPLAAFNL